jgi:hypothetical protein
MRFRWVKVRFRRRYLVILVFLMVLPMVFILMSNSVSRLSSPHVQSAASPPSPYCRTGDPLAGVYNPLRFRVLSSCQVAIGTVKSVTLQYDGDQRIDVLLDAQYTKLLAVGNTNYHGGMLVLELIPQDQANIPVPSVGQHITFVGPLVYDTENHWNAIYPVWSIRAD